MTLNGQNDFWSQTLLTASIGEPDRGVLLEFPVSSRRVSGGRRVPSRIYPFRNGQDYEDVGQEPRTYELEVPLFRGMDPSYYPDLQFRVREFIESDEQRGECEYTDPEDGPLRCKMLPYGWSTGSDQREGGILTLRFETIGEDATILTSPAIQGPFGAASVSADSLDAALAEGGVSSATLADAFDAGGVPIGDAEIAAGVDPNDITFAAVTDFYEDQVLSGPGAPEDLAAAIDTMRIRVGSMNAIATTLGAEDGYAVLAAAGVLSEAATAIGESQFARLPRVVEYPVRVLSSAIEIASRELGDPNRVSEVLSLNPALDPNFIEPGTVLVLPLDEVR